MNKNIEKELTSFDLVYEKAKIFCKENPEWEMICNIEDSDSLYYTWEELREDEQKPWIDYYGKLDADKAWREFSYGKCKVENGCIAEDGIFYRDHPLDKNAMRIFKIGGINKNVKNTSCRFLRRYEGSKKGGMIDGKNI
jgi:hypothetical protein